MTEQQFEAICQEIEISSFGLRYLTKKHGSNPQSFYNFVEQRAERIERYARAKDRQADYMVEEMLDIADDGSNDLMTVQKGNDVYEQENKEVVNRSRLRVDTRKWVAAKLKPKKYGDKIDLGLPEETKISVTIGKKNGD